MTAVLLALLVGACATWITLALPARRRSWIDTRIAPHVAARAGVQHEGRPARFATVAPITRLTARLLIALRLKGLLRLELGRAGSGWTPEQLAWVTLGAASGIFALTLAAGSTRSALPFALLAAVSPHCLLRLRAVRRAKAFDQQLPDILDMLVGSLTVGHSFDQSLRAVADGAAEPAASEFKHALGEIRLGRPSRAALAEVATRLRSGDLPFVLTAVDLQQQVGGSLAGLLQMVADTVRERQQFRRKVKALTGMGRASAAALIALPFLAAIGLSIMQPTYMQPMWQTTTGRELVVGALVLMALGSFILKRIVSIGS